MYPPTSRDLVEEFASRAVNRDANFTNILQAAPAAGPGPNQQRVRQFAGSHRHEQHRALFPVLRREERAGSEHVHPEPASARRLRQDQARPRFAGRHVVPRGDGHERAGLCRDGDEQNHRHGRNDHQSGPGGAARCRRRSKCCASAWTRSAWPSRSSSRRAAIAF